MRQLGGGCDFPLVRRVPHPPPWARTHRLEVSSLRCWLWCCTPGSENLTLRAEESLSLDVTRDLGVGCGVPESSPSPRRGLRSREVSARGAGRPGPRGLVRFPAEPLARARARAGTERRNCFPSFASATLTEACRSSFIS